MAEGDCHTPPGGSSCLVRRFAGHSAWLGEFCLGHAAPVETAIHVSGGWCWACWRWARNGTERETGKIEDAACGGGESALSRRRGARGRQNITVNGITARHNSTA